MRAAQTTNQTRAGCSGLARITKKKANPMDAAQEVNRMLEENGAVLKRNKKHEVWELPNGQTFVRASTPGDSRAAFNELSQLRRCLGIDDKRGEPGERRERKAKQKPARPAFDDKPKLSTGLADQLRVRGVAEDALRDEIEALKAENEALRGRLCACLWCRILRRMKGGSR
jgi:hypothetical protein